MLKTKQLEKIIKGFSNHRRIEILMLLGAKPELSLINIAEELKINFRTAWEHVRRLAIAGLILKRNEGSFVRHALSPAGKHVLRFLGTLE